MANNSAVDLEEAKKMQNQMSEDEIRLVLYEQDPSVLLESSYNARPKRGGMTRVFPDGHVILKGGIEESFNNSSLTRVPIITGTNKDENKFFNALNRNFVKWGPASGLYKTVGVDEMPLEIIDPDYYDAISFYGSSFWKQRAVDTPARKLIQSGHVDTYAYRFDWDELAEPLGMDFPEMLGAAHGLEISFVFGEMSMGDFDQILITEDNASGRAELSRAMMAYWANFARSGNPNLGVNVPSQWLPWLAEEQYLVLDTNSEENTGIRMSSETTRYQDLMQQLKEDERFDSQEERCGVLFRLSRSSPELLSWKTVIGC